MDTVTFTLNGKSYRLTRAQVIAAMRGQFPGTIQVYAVDIAGVWFPPKQVLAQALQIKAREFITTRAQDILSKLGFRVVDVEIEPNYATKEPLAQVADSKTSGTSADRELALRLAVQLHSGRDISLTKVVDAADALLAWLTQ